MSYKEFLVHIFKGKLHGTFEMSIFCLLSFIRHPYLYYSFIKASVSAVERVVLDKKVIVQCHDFILLNSHKVVRQNGLSLALVLNLGGHKTKC